MALTVNGNEAAFGKEKSNCNFIKYVFRHEKTGFCNDLFRSFPVWVVKGNKLDNCP